MQIEDLKYKECAFKEAYDKALDSFIEHEQYVLDDRHMVIVNYREPSFRRRLYLVNLDEDKMVSAHHVSHAMASSNLTNKSHAMYFSNNFNTNMSSLGAMLTGETFIGSHGYSLKLNGLEKGINNNVAKRQLVLNEDPILGQDYILRNERAGCSFGNYSVAPGTLLNIVPKIKNGVFFYVYI